jgi:hypothetical protein
VRYAGWPSRWCRWSFRGLDRLDHRKGRLDHRKGRLDRRKGQLDRRKGRLDRRNGRGLDRLDHRW